MGQLYIQNHGLNISVFLTLPFSNSNPWCQILPKKKKKKPTEHLVLPLFFKNPFGSNFQSNSFQLSHPQKLQNFQHEVQHVV